LIPVDPDRQELLRDRDGQTVRSRLDESRLRAIAEQTGAFYVHLENGAMSRLIDSGLRKLGEGKIDDRSTRIPIERYRWPLIFGMLLLLLSAALKDRRKKQGQVRRTPVPGAVAVVMASILNAHGNPGLDHYNQGDFDKALENFREELKHDPDSPTINFNFGDANYRLQKYDEAFEAYSKAMVSSDAALQEKAYYNAGNSLFMEGNHAQDLEQQLSNYYDARYQYNQALNRNPGDEQAKKNLRLLEERIRDAEKQKEQERQRQQKQHRQRPRKPKSRNRNQQQEGQKGQKPDQPGSEGTDPDDQQTPGDQQLGPSDQNQNGDDDQPDEPTPSPKKDGQLREITPSDEQKQQMQQSQESKPGMMSEDEALGLLDSLKDESDKIDLMHRKTDRGVLRDW
jgi:Ca-activated chloride channel homolog